MKIKKKKKMKKNEKIKMNFCTCNKGQMCRLGLGTTVSNYYNQGYV